MADPTKPLIGEDQLLIDSVSGFAINIPAERQKPYAWWVTYPEHYKAIVEMRKALGIEIVDNLTPDDSEAIIEELFGEEQ